MEIKRLEFLIDGVGRAYFVNPAVDLKTVVVHDHHQIVKLTETGEHSRFPHLAFLNLAVAQKSVYSVGVVAEFRGKSHSHCRGDTLSERSAGHIHARDMFHIRMSLKIGTQMTESLQIFFGEVSSLCQNGIQARRCVSFGEDETVAVRLLRIFGIDVHFFKIQVCKYICRRKRSARMAGFCSMDCRYDIFADFVGNLLKF